jgi:mono/diheme cytochrome c family protein
MLHSLKALLVAGAVLGLSAVPAAAQSQVERGRYLASIGGCGDCHTPGHFLGKPDMARVLGGSEVAFEIPGLGSFAGPNLTPDKETGLGKWSDAQVIAAIRTGVRPDGRILAPVMPWRQLSVLTDQDARALVAYLRSLKPVRNKGAGPFGPSEKPTTLVMKIVPPEGAPVAKP